MLTRTVCGATKMAGYVLSVLVTFSFLATAFVQGDDDHGSNAISYDQETFKLGLAKNRNFVMFYAPWCGHCKNLAPTWDELAKIYNKGDDVTVAKVDCTVHASLCADHEVTGFPTLLLFPVGGESHKRYTGKRDLESLKSFVQGQLTGEGGQETGDTQKEEGKPEVPSGEGESSLIILTDDNFLETIAEGAFFIKFYAPWCGHCKRLAPTWDELADAFADNEKVSIAKIDCTQSSVICKKYEVRGYPTLLWFQEGENLEKYQSVRSLEALKEFVNRKLSGGQEQDKEEVDGEEYEEGKVMNLSSETFESFLESKLVFVKFFAPWCGHCKRMAPVWESLAQEVKDLPIAIAKIDCTQHKTVCDENGVRGYPTLKLFNKGKLVKDYKGGRALEDFQKFVKKELEKHDEL